VEPALFLIPIAITAYAGVEGHPRVIFIGFAAALTAILVRGAAWLLAWRVLLALVVLLILFVPVQMYALPATLPFSLEPYRLLVAFVAFGWIGSLLVDSRVRLRAAGPVDIPLAAFAATVVAGEIANHSRVSSVGSDVIKRLLFFASFGLLVYLIVSVVRTRRDVDFLIKTLVLGGAILGAFALIERRTGYNVFDHLSSFVPGLRQVVPPVDLSRGGTLRVIASSQHPIALGAAFVMLVPLALYLARAHGGRWWVGLGLTVAGTFASFSRTPVLMLTVVLLVFIWLRPHEMKRLWPAVLPLLLAVHFALPGTIGSLKDTFFPSGGLIHQQEVGGVGSGRIATLGPALHRELAPDPVLGEGFGTRVTEPDEVVRVPNAPILDDQWLGTLLETGIVGAFCIAWMFVRFTRRVGREAKEDDSWRGWLLACITASVAAYGVSMFTYDAFSFIQVTFILFITIAIGCVVYRLPREDASVDREPDAVVHSGYPTSARRAVRPNVDIQLSSIKIARMRRAESSEGRPR
jgi:hypothetical protein